MTAKPPLKLQKILYQRGLSVTDVGLLIRNKRGNFVSRSTISLCLNHGTLPLHSTPDFKAQMEAVLLNHGVSSRDIDTCWERESADSIITIHALKNPKKTKLYHDDNLKEAEVLTPTTMRLFKIFRNPFIDDIQKNSDVFMSESHRYAHAAMVDAARNGGFVAICGECGAGKTVMRRKLTVDLNAEGNMRIIRPRQSDGGMISAHALAEAIILDIDIHAKPMRTRESRARQLEKMLLGGFREGLRNVLILEEAHDLSLQTLKMLKRLWEIEDGYRKVLGIVLIGQPELKDKMDIRNHPEMREVILRCLISELLPLGTELEDYVALKFQRIGLELSQVFEEGWADAVRQRLTSFNGSESSSRLYPLYIHNILASAMNDAAEMGETLVSADTILGA